MFLHTEQGTQPGAGAQHCPRGNGKQGTLTEAHHTRGNGEQGPQPGAGFPI